MKIAFIGLGHMGGPMAANLVKAGHEVRGFDVVPAALEIAHDNGVGVAGSAAEAAAGAEVVITMLLNGAQVIEVYNGGLLAAATPGTHFLITVPAHLSLWSPHDVAFGHYRRYDRERLMSVWAGLPVNVKLCSYYNARLYPAVRGVRTMNRLLGRSSGASGTDFNLPAAPINEGLTRLFAGEASRLIEVIEGRRQRAYRTGVSLMALIERQSGEIPVRQKPDWIAADVYNPRQRRELAAVD
jgi:hypothetical protein